ncbi:hypothetical protein R5R35_001940 [Gryllus longicercus]|uniref:Major facilitator superfamily (MFS) profile domain-containing protein n=1 Tax=Gryllus longicercus TaxID=2509291 RepID=A0AAN9VY83_9ORTH
MDFDEILEELGEFGRYQITNYLLICLPVFFAAANSLSYVFTAAVPRYRCLVPGCDEGGGAAKYAEAWVERAVPPLKGARPGAFSPEYCLRFVALGNASASHPDGCPIDFGNAEERCDQWVFDSEDIWTIVGQWNITCSNKQWQLSLVGTVHFAGIFLGTILFGFLADRFGRKLVFIFCILLMSVTGVAQAVAPDYIVFQVFVFLNALGTSGVFPLAFIIGVELVGRRRREMSGIVLNYFYALGEAAVALVAWLSRDWVWLQLLVSAPAGIFVIYYWFIPESVRWLLARREDGRATRIIRRAAEVNGVVLSERLLTPPSPDPAKEGEKGGEAAGGPEQVQGLLATVLQVARSRKLLVRALLLFFIWAANAFVYYGLSVNSTSLGGDKYLNFALVCLVEIPGYTVAWLLMNRLGRRMSLGGSLGLCALTCIGAAFVPVGMEWAEIVLFLVGKLGITSSFGVVFVYTAELYPTPMRSAGVGMSSTVARVGAMVAPFAPLLGQVYAPLPLLLFGGVSLIASLFTLTLPETLGTRLPDTVDEVEKL